MLKVEWTPQLRYALCIKKSHGGYLLGRFYAEYTRTGRIKWRENKFHGIYDKFEHAEQRMDFLLKVEQGVIKHG